MKVLLAHNFYGSDAPSGENRVVQAELDLLQTKGHEVEVFSRHSDGIRASGVMGLVRGALATPWNPFAARAISETVSWFRPDVVHVHNTFPLISPSIFRAIGPDAARILTLHNYRVLCPAAIPMRNGNVCTLCIDSKSSWPAVRYGCYRSSRLATIPLALNVSLQKFLGTWREDVDAFIALTDFQRDVVSQGGLPFEKIHVKPNFHEKSAHIVPWVDRGNYVLFVGRLSPEKGVRTLIKAWSEWGELAPKLLIVGDGELRLELEALSTNLPIEFLGQLSKEETHKKMANANLLILPSECFEGFPLVLIEALAVGVPVAVSEIAAFPSIVASGNCGIVFKPGEPSSLVQQVRTLWLDPDWLEEMGRNAKAEFDLKYTADRNYERLMDIYGHAKAMKNQSIGKG